VDQLRQLARVPEVAVPIGVLAVGVVILAIAIALIRPDATVTAAIIAAVAGAYGSVISLILNRHYERHRESEEHARLIEEAASAKKVPVYEEFVGFWLDTLFAERMGKPKPTAEDIMQGFVTWTKPILMWGSDEVVRSWGRLRIDMARYGKDPQGLFAFEDFLIMLRRDAGYPDTTVGKGDILRLFVNDVDQYLDATTDTAVIDAEPPDHVKTPR